MSAGSRRRAKLWVTMPQNPGGHRGPPPKSSITVPDQQVRPTHTLNITFPASGPEALGHRRHAPSRVHEQRHRRPRLCGRSHNHAVVETWQNGCSGLTVNLELDEARGLVIVDLRVGSARGARRRPCRAPSSARSRWSAWASMCAPTTRRLHHAYLAGQDSADTSPSSPSPRPRDRTLLGKVAHRERLADGGGRRIRKRLGRKSSRRPPAQGARYLRRDALSESCDADAIVSAGT